MKKGLNYCVVCRQVSVTYNDAVSMGPLVRPKLPACTKAGWADIRPIIYIFASLVRTYYSNGMREVALAPVAVYLETGFVYSCRLCYISRSWEYESTGGGRHSLSRSTKGDKHSLWISSG